MTAIQNWPGLRRFQENSGESCDDRHAIGKGPAREVSASMAEWPARLTEGETDMNVQETTGTLGIRELTATELDHVSGGQTFFEWFADLIDTAIIRGILQDGHW